MRDYVEILLDTGARPCVELINLRGNQITYRIDLFQSPGAIDLEQDVSDDLSASVEVTDLNKTVELVVSGKTGRRTIMGGLPNVAALTRIARRNYGVKADAAYPLKDVAKPNNNDFVLRASEKKLDISSSFQKILEGYLKECDLLSDPVTEQKRVLYSFNIPTQH